MEEWQRLSVLHEARKSYGNGIAEILRRDEASIFPGGHDFRVQVSSGNFPGGGSDGPVIRFTPARLIDLETSAGAHTELPLPIVLQFRFGPTAYRVRKAQVI